MSAYDDFDWEDLLGDSNGPAYRTTEVRSGPPLTYVGEKLRHSLEQLHDLLRLTEQTDATSLASSAQAAFHYGLVAYLALENMLNLANDTNLIRRLPTMSRGEFLRWLDAIEAEGSATG